MIDIVAPYIALAVVMFVIRVLFLGWGAEMSVSVSGVLVLIAFAVWNSGYRLGTTGQSIGRRLTKTKLVKIETGEPIGFSMALLRLICIAVTLGLAFVTVGIIFLIVFLKYLWDLKRQTVADKIVKAVVVRVDDATA